ncbi:hypothetical protein E8E12_003400 [Didymella heteroderae]|uniref:Uncharacterized protein n=1 Tax=Didymella heteroderae TaxID=1769908 RepID=A0A9P4WGV6_9PLEO|nr:hypothetical protein E8E12_003400 [Didymella heteroderae]
MRLVTVSTKARNSAELIGKRVLTVGVSVSNGDVPTLRTGRQGNTGAETAIRRTTSEEEGSYEPDLAELLRMEEEKEHRLANDAHANLFLPYKWKNDDNPTLAKVDSPVGHQGD